MNRFYSYFYCSPDYLFNLNFITILHVDSRTKQHELIKEIDLFYYIGIGGKIMLKLFISCIQIRISIKLISFGGGGGGNTTYLSLNENSEFFLSSIAPEPVHILTLSKVTRSTPAIEVSYAFPVTAQGQRFDGFRIVYGTDPSNQTEITVDSTTSSYVIENLETSVEYTVTVTTFSGVRADLEYSIEETSSIIVGKYYYLCFT